MRFKEFIREEDDKPFDIEQFQQDCAFYIGEAKKATGQWSKLMLHGSSKMKDATWHIHDFTPRSAPRNSPEVTHEAFNRFMTRRFGYPFRNGLFVSSNEYMAASYGTPYAIFPIGQFEWLCNIGEGYSDLTTAYLDFRRDEGLEVGSKDYLATSLFMDKIRASATWRHNESLPQCLNSGNEIMIKCDKFYAIWERSDEMQAIKKLLK